MRERRKRSGSGRRVARASRLADEPVPEGDDWVEWGGQLMWAAGFTEGGAPYGLTVEEFRQGNERMEPRAGWARAKAVLRKALGPMLGRYGEEGIGWVRFLAEGLCYRVFRAECSLTTSSGEERKDLVVRLPRPDAPWDLTQLARRELRVLEHLVSLELPVRLPRVVAAVPVAEALALVQEMVHGIPLDPRAGRQGGVRPWEIVAEAAGICHGVDPAPLGRWLPSHPTRRAHALAEIRSLEAVDMPEARAAREWALDNLPPEEPSRLVHGDLLGQNLLLAIEAEPLGVIDWEHAVIGDPAYDLAIVTRGVRQPFQLDHGMRKLLEAYKARRQADVGARDIHLYELCLMARFHEADCQRYGRGSPAAESRRRAFRSLLERAERA